MKYRDKSTGAIIITNSELSGSWVRVEDTEDKPKKKTKTDKQKE